jgi:hypothetical protein
MMRISCHDQQRFIDVGPWYTKANAGDGEGQQQRTPKLVVENAKCEMSDSYPKSRRAAMRNKNGETREWKTNECLVVEGGRALTDSYSLYRDVPAGSVAQNIQEGVGSQEKRSRDEAGATGMSLGVTSSLSMIIMIKVMEGGCST